VARSAASNAFLVARRSSDEAAVALTSFGRYFTGLGKRIELPSPACEGGLLSGQEDRETCTRTTLPVCAPNAYRTANAVYDARAYP